MIWPEGTERCLAARLNAVWLWVCFAQLHWLIASFWLADAGWSLATGMLTVCTLVSFAVFFVARAVTITIYDYTEGEHAAAPPEREPTVSVIAPVDAERLYSPAGTLPPRFRELLVSASIVVAWMLAVTAGFALAVTRPELARTLYGEGDRQVRFMDLCVYCWSTMPVLRAYAGGLMLIAAHVVLYLNARPLHIFTDILVFGPWLEEPPG